MTPRVPPSPCRRSPRLRDGLRFTDATSGGIAGTDIEGILNAPDSVAYVLSLPAVHDPGIGGRGNGATVREYARFGYL